MQEKISLTVFKDHAIIEAQDILRDIGFPVIGEPVALSGGEENQRSIAFLVGNNELSKQLEGSLPGLLGVAKCSFQPKD